MHDITELESSAFSREKFFSLKGAKKLFVVFSTIGDREAGHIARKFGLLKKEAGDLIDSCILSHRREGNSGDSTEHNAKRAWSGAEVVICNEVAVPDMGAEKGKGADMRRCLYHINTGLKGGASCDDVVVVFLDADVQPEYFGTHFVLGLAGAVLAGHDFAKASFWREMGRVKKYVAQPLFSIIDHPLLRRLSGLAYPLSGEAAGTLRFFNSVHFWQRYGVETGINLDSCAGSYRIADVNLGLYDHEHHDDFSIQKMSFGIIRAYMKQLVDYGIIELKKGARIGDIFDASYIDEHGRRKSIHEVLDEKKYVPLEEIL